MNYESLTILPFLSKSLILSFPSSSFLEALGWRLRVGGSGLDALGWRLWVGGSGVLSGNALNWC